MDLSKRESTEGTGKAMYVVHLESAGGRVDRFTFEESSAAYNFAARMRHIYKSVRVSKVNEERKEVC